MPQPDWDEDSPQLQANLDRVASLVVREAISRGVPSLGMAKQWHSVMMQGLKIRADAPHPGVFRGEPGVPEFPVGIGGIACTRCRDVAATLRQFETKLRRDIADLQKRYPTNEDLDYDGINAAVDLAAWVHAEWVRIHPFANGNGRTARAWANYVLARFGIPPAIRLRPRPDGNYAAAAEASMPGDWKPTIGVFIAMITEAIQQAATTPRRNAPK